MHRRHYVVPPAELIVTLLAAGVALWGWIELEANMDLGAAIALYAGAFVGLGLLGSLATSAAGEEDDPEPADAERTLPLPGPSAWLLPLALVPVMAISLPIAFHRSPGDTSVLALLVVFVVLFSYSGLLVGAGLWVFVVYPMGMFVAFLVRRNRREPAPPGMRAVLVLTTGKDGRPVMRHVVRPAAPKVDPGELPATLPT